MDVVIVSSSITMFCLGGACEICTMKISILTRNVCFELNQNNDEYDIVVYGNPKL